jgi:hypothetical protein
MQHRITKPSKLLNKHGVLIQKGYATSPLLKYLRKDVANKQKLKEWDYYLIDNHEYAVALTVGKSGSIVLISASLIDLKTKKETTKSVIRLVSDKKLSMPQSSETGDIIYHDKNVNVSFKNYKGDRELSLSIKGFLKNENFDASLLLAYEPQDSMVIATPFKEDKKLFYYNRKIIGMRATGTVHLGNQTITFKPIHSFGLLDWGRGAWPHHTTWYWSAAQGMVCGNLFGFNLGYGFGDTTKATENMLFFNGIASKLEDVTFHIPKNDKNEYDYMKSWIITSSDRRLELVFMPIIDRSVNLSIILLSTNQHQVFGTFTGTAILDDGTIVFLQDFMGFAERVENKW